MDLDQPPRAPSARRTAIRSWLWAIFCVLLAIGIGYTVLLFAL